MSAVLTAFRGAQRRCPQYHIGGCSSCGFQTDGNLEQVCARNGNLNVSEVLLEHIRSSHKQDAKNPSFTAGAAEMIKSMDRVNC